MCIVYWYNIPDLTSKRLNITDSEENSFRAVIMIRKMKKRRYMQGGTVLCSVKGCSKMFHFPCGYTAGCLFLFHGRYQVNLIIVWDSAADPGCFIPDP
jgi:hypothetical protein